MAQSLCAWFGNFVDKPTKDDNRVKLFSKLGGTFIGSMRKQHPLESQKMFLKRVKKHVARLMPHHLGFTWKCVALEVYAQHVVVAWDDNKAKQLVKDKYGCLDVNPSADNTHYLTNYMRLKVVAQQSLVPEVAVYQSVTRCYLAGKCSMTEPEFCDLRALSGLPSLKFLLLQEGDFDLQFLVSPSLSKLELRGVRVKNVLSLPKTLKKLVTKGAQHTQVAFRDFVTNFSLLEKLKLDGNNMTGSLPSELSRFKLKTLKVVRNKLSNNIPTFLGSISTLEKLDLSGNLLEGCIPNEVSGLVLLSVLRLANNQLSGEIPVCLFRLHLMRLDLSNNQLVGKIPALNFGQQLILLDLSRNQLTGQIPTFEEAPNLSCFCVQHNNLTGSIPSSMASLGRVGNMNISYNRLTGRIPSELGNWNSFNFDASHNRLSGRLPSELLNAEFFTLDLSHNRLSGSLPRELILCGHQATLCLQHNRLTGNYPTRIGTTCTDFPVKLVDLSDNFLCGRGPQYHKADTTFECENNVNHIGSF